MAFSTLEPFGSLHDEFMHGQVAAVIANVNRDPKRRADPFGASDFMPALADSMPAPPPVLLDDPQAQGDLLMGALFPGTMAKLKEAGQ